MGLCCVGTWVWPGLLSGVTRSCTLGVGTVGVGTLGVSCVDIFGVGLVSSFSGVLLGVIDSKIAANFFISCILSVPGCLNGVIGVRFFKALVRSNAAIVAASALESPGTLQCLGKILQCRLFLRAQLWNNILYVHGSAQSLAPHTTR
jgi:hypothetical protein